MFPGTLRQSDSGDSVVHTEGLKGGNPGARCVPRSRLHKNNGLL